MRRLTGYILLALVFGRMGSLEGMAHAESPALPPFSIPFSLLDLKGESHDLNQNEQRHVRVFVYISVECPISNSYVATLNDLYTKSAGPGTAVDFFGVFDDATMTRKEVTEQFVEFQPKFPILFDSSSLLATILEPTHVPEAFVLDRDGNLVYRGAIDNLYAGIGKRRVRSDKLYLEDAISAALSAKRPAESYIKPIGCQTGKVVAKETRTPITYNRDIAPIVQARCLNCHRDGQVAPFSLGTYSQVSKRAEQVLSVVTDRIMPPWIPSPGHDRLIGERRLTEREVAIFQAWVKGGSLEGDPNDLPPVPKFVDGWRMGEPDMIVKMPLPFTVHAAGPDILQNFVIPLDIKEDKLVAAIEFHPGNKRVDHHALLFLDISGTARRLDKATAEPGYPSFGGPGFLPSGSIGGWSVGNTPRALPNGIGRHLRKGSDLVLQMHYHPSGKPETDQSEVGIYFVKKPVAESMKEGGKIVVGPWVSKYEIDIPPGAKDYRRTASYKLPTEVTLVGVVPHMHKLGKSAVVKATFPDKSTKTLLKIDQWNYNWQDEYYYERPFKLPAGTELSCEAVFDNSADNPLNPSSPPERVVWGDGTNHEMLFCFFLVTTESTNDLVKLVVDNLFHDAKQPRLKPEPQTAK